jgi:hypothetical protein
MKPLKQEVLMQKDNVTMNLPEVPPKRGRPATGRALDGAARMRAYRERKASEGKSAVTVYLDSKTAAALAAYVERQNADQAEQLVTLGDAVDRILRDRLLRKR